MKLKTGNCGTRLALLASGMMLLAGANWAHWAHAQDFPNRLVRLITGGSQGGPVDIASRVVAQRLAELWSQAVIVENRVGASEILAGEAVSKAKPDGYTLLIAGNVITHNPALFAKLQYDPERGFAPITLMMQSPMALVIAANTPHQTLSDLIAAAKQRSGQLAWASAGIGTNNHLAGEQFALLAGIKAIHTPYKGSQPAAAAVLGGEVAYGIVALTSALANAKAGTLRLLALTSEKRSPLAPGVPSLAEQGVSGVDGAVRAGLVGPVGLPQAIIARVNADVNRILAEPQIRERFATLGMEPLGTTPEEYDAYNKRMITQVRAIVAQAGIKVE